MDKPPGAADYFGAEESSLPAGQKLCFVPKRLDFFPFVCKIKKEVYKAELHCDLKGKRI